MQLEKVKEDIRKMLNAQRLGVLATYRGKFPYRKGTPACWRIEAFFTNAQKIYIQS